MPGITTTKAIREALESTTLPPHLVDQLVSEAPITWLMGEPAEGVAADLVLCHPSLGPNEVRAAAWPTTTPGAWKLTVVAHDRPGLLAALAGSLAERGLSIVKASASVWPELDLAVQRTTVVSAARPETGLPDWDLLGQRLRDVLGGGQAPVPDFHPKPPVEVDAHPQSFGRALVTIKAPDRPGLLWAIADWLARHECNVEAYGGDLSGDTAVITLVVAGEADYSELASVLGGRQARSDLPATVGRVRKLVGGLIAGAAAVVWRRHRARR